MEVRLAFNFEILSEKNCIKLAARDSEHVKVGSIEEAERWRMPFKADQSFRGFEAELVFVVISTSLSNKLRY